MASPNTSSTPNNQFEKIPLFSLTDPEQNLYTEQNDFIEQGTSDTVVVQVSNEVARYPLSRFDTILLALIKAEIQQQIDANHNSDDVEDTVSSSSSSSEESENDDDQASKLDQIAKNILSDLQTTKIYAESKKVYEKRFFTPIKLWVAAFSALISGLVASSMVNGKYDSIFTKQYDKIVREIYAHDKLNRSALVNCVKNPISFCNETYLSLLHSLPMDPWLDNPYCDFSGKGNVTSTNYHESASSLPTTGIPVYFLLEVLTGLGCAKLGLGQGAELFISKGVTLVFQALCLSDALSWPHLAGEAAKNANDYVARHSMKESGVIDLLDGAEAFPCTFHERKNMLYNGTSGLMTFREMSQKLETCKAPYNYNNSIIEGAMLEGVFMFVVLQGLSFGVEKVARWLSNNKEFQQEFSIDTGEKSKVEVKLGPTIEAKVSECISSNQASFWSDELPGEPQTNDVFSIKRSMNSLRSSSYQ